MPGVKSSKTYVILLLTATTLGGAALAWQQYGELVELRASALNRDERADLQKRIWDLEKLNRELQDQLAAQSGDGMDVDELFAEATGSDVAPASRERSDRGGSESRGRSSGLQQMTAMRELMSKPEVQAMLSLQQKAAIETRYAALFRNLNLPVEQIEKLKTLLTDRTASMQDVMSAARDQGINPRENPEAFRKLVSDVQNQINDGIKSVIGEQGFAQLTNYEQTMPQRNVINELQQRLSYTSTPLTPAQAEQMVQILATNTPQRQTRSPSSANAQSSGRGGPPGGRSSDLGGKIAGALGGSPGIAMAIGAFDGARGSAPVTGAAVSQAQTVLAPPQVAALQQIQQQQQTQQQLRQLMSDTMKANQPAGSKSGNVGKAGVGAAAGDAKAGGPSSGRRRGGG